MKGDSTFKGVLSQRLNYVRPIVHWWNSNNVKVALNAVERITDPTILMDVFNMTTISTKIPNLNLEGVTIFVAKARILIESKFQPHIKVGLELVRKILRQYRDVNYLIPIGADLLR